MPRRTGTIVLATTAIAGLVVAGSGIAAGSGTAVASPHAPSALIATPQFTVTISGKHHFAVSGPRHFSAGRIDVTLIAKKGEQEVGIARLHKGYTYADANRDFGKFFSAQKPSPAALRALNRVAHRVTFYGGLDSGKSHTTVSGSFTLRKAGTYLVLDDENGPGAAKPVKLHVSKRVGNRITPPSSATVKATSAKRWAGARQLPATGTITFKNVSNNSPHFLVLDHVKKGTTRRQVIKTLNSNFQGRPSFALSGEVDSDVLSPGLSQTLTYSLPSGSYAEMCFFPDLKTGIPHAMMGMVRIVHLH